VVPVSSFGISGTKNQTIVAIRRDGWYTELVTGAVTAAPDVVGFAVSKRCDDSIVVADVETGNRVDVCGHLKTNGLEARGFCGQAESCRKTAEKQLPFNDCLTEAWSRFRAALNPEQAGGSPIQSPVDPELVGDLATSRFEVAPKGIKTRRTRPVSRAGVVLLVWAYGQTATTRLSEQRSDQCDGFRTAKHQANVTFACAMVGVPRSSIRSR